MLIVEAEPTAESTVENEPQAESETQTDPEIEVNAEEQPTLSPRQHFDLEDLPSDNPIAPEEEDIESLQSELQECMDQASDSVTSSVNERQSTYPMRSNRGYPKDLGPNSRSRKIFKMKKFVLCGIGFCFLRYCFICII